MAKTEKEKYYYIKCYMLVNDEYKPYGYFMEFDWIDYVPLHPELDIATVSEIEFAKKYKRRCWAEKMIQKICEETKDNVFLFDDEGKYKYKFEIIEI